MDIKKLLKNASRDTIAANSELQGSKPKRNQEAALGGAVQRKAEGVSRITVRFFGYRCRPLDPDNFAGGCKDLLDGLRHSGLLHSDDPWAIDFQTAQYKVDHRSEEGTIIEIEY